jgi:hypothetical protein
MEQVGKPKKKMPWAQKFVPCCIRMPEGLNRLLLQKSRKERLSKSSIIVKAVSSYLESNVD